MAAQIKPLVLESRGLQLSTGHLVREKGALVEALNVFAEAPGTLRKRFGFARQGNLGSNFWSLLNVSAPGVARLLAADGSSVYTSNDDGTTWTNRGAMATGVLVAEKLRSVMAARNSYLFSTDSLSQRLESDLSLWPAGLPLARPLDEDGLVVVSIGDVLTSTGAAIQALDDLQAASYRCTICKYDAGGRLMEGPVSGRTVVRNAPGTPGYTALTASVQCRVVVPRQFGGAAMTTAHFYRVYRSLAADDNGTPQDEHFLIKEAYFTAPDIAAGYVDFVDDVPDEFLKLSPPLYVNALYNGDIEPLPTRDVKGVELSNAAPSTSQAAEVFADCLWGSGDYRPPVLAFTILATGAPNGVQVGDIITIGGVAFTGVALASAPLSSGEFVVYSGLASISEDIERTALSLVNAINRDVGASYSAQYVAGASGLPGQITVQTNTLTSASVLTALASAHGDAYRPPLDTTLASVDGSHPNYLYFSKPGRYEAVPDINFLSIGDGDTQILALRTLREQLFVFTNRGLYVVSGSSSADFQIQEFDLSFRIWNNEMVALCDDALWAWGQEGIARIDSSGVKYVSSAIEPLLQSVTPPILVTTGLKYGLITGVGYAVAHQYRHKVFFFYRTTNGGPNCPVALCLDTRTGAFSSISTPDSGRSCAVVRNADDVMFSGEANSATSYCYKERRTGTDADYVDTNRAGAATPVSEAVTWTPQVPDPAVLSLFDELHIFWEISDVFPQLGVPSTCTVTFTGDNGVPYSVTITPSAGWPSSKTEVPLDARQGARLRIRITNAVGEFVGIEGLSLRSSSQGSSIRT